MVIIAVPQTVRFERGVSAGRDSRDLRHLNVGIELRAGLVERKKPFHTAIITNFPFIREAPPGWRSALKQKTAALLSQGRCFFVAQSRFLFGRYLRFTGISELGRLLVFLDLGNQLFHAHLRALRVFLEVALGLDFGFPRRDRRFVGRFVGGCYAGGVVVLQLLDDAVGHRFELALVGVLDVGANVIVARQIGVVERVALQRRRLVL